MTNQELMDIAKGAAANAYAPYSGFSVGAALLAASGKVYIGANIENASFGATICAERIAAAAAIMAGERMFTALAVYAENATGPKTAWPCGICRQFLTEFGTDMQIIAGQPDGGIAQKTLTELMPEAFTQF